jgi:hypothetical protein
MRKYSAVDLLRFHKLANENVGKKPMELIRMYNEAVPELSEKQKLLNLAKALKIPELIAAIERKQPTK